VNSVGVAGVPDGGLFFENGDRAAGVEPEGSFAKMSASPCPNQKALSCSHGGAFCFYKPAYV